LVRFVGQASLPASSLATHRPVALDFVTKVADPLVRTCRLGARSSHRPVFGPHLPPPDDGPHWAAWRQRFDALWADIGEPRQSIPRDEVSDVCWRSFEGLWDSWLEGVNRGLPEAFGVLGPVGQPFIFEERRISEVFRPSRPERLCSAGLLLRTLVRAAGFWLAETSGVGRDTIGKQIRALRLGDSGPAVQLQGLFRHEAADEEQIRAATELAKSEADALETEARRLRLQRVPALGTRLRSPRGMPW
jgi:hypothetical protein